jgi:hypothetical protein
LHARLIGIPTVPSRRERRTRLLVLAVIVCAVGCFGCHKQDDAARNSPADSDGAANIAAQIDWEDLIPKEELENHRLAMAFAMRRVDHGSDQRTPQFGSFKTVAAMDGRRIELAGYVVPIETDDQGLMSAFFLVPSVGACIHVPPPPPDQMVYVALSRSIPAPELGDARQIRGILHTQTHNADIASAAYSMQDPELMSPTRDK